MKKKLIVGFSTSSSKYSIPSLLIRFFQKTKFSHTYIRFTADRYSRCLVYHASGTSVNFIEFEAFRSRNLILEEFELELPLDKFDSVVVYAIDTVGKPYSFKALLGLALLQLGIKVDRLLKSGESSFICSELVIRALKAAGVLDVSKDPDLITPKDVYNYVKENLNESASVS